ncbi:thioredoxin domain-containing protein [Pontixanthobacter sp.]|uniref:thioredoxin domain-containing protein n=1 Tax=Pontixanthobacter sp. TaxID=2792078 RepID=UPI003C79D3B7
MTTFRIFALAALAAPLTLTLAACGSSDEPAPGAVSGDPIAPIAAPEGTSWTDVVTVSDSDGYIVGNPDAPIKLMEYASLTCPTCANFATTAIEELKSEYVSTGRVSFELRNQIHGPHDLALATLVRCGAPEGVHALSDQVFFNQQAVLAPIFANQDAVQQAVTLPEDQRLVRIAEIGGFIDFFSARGISGDQARSCLADAAKYTQIAQNSDTQSRELGVTGTPTFFINGNRVDGNSWSQIEPLLQQAGAR